MSDDGKIHDVPAGLESALRTMLWEAIDRALAEATPALAARDEGRQLRIATRALAWYADDRHQDAETGAHGDIVRCSSPGEPDECDWENDQGSRAYTALRELGHLPEPPDISFAADDAAKWEAHEEAIRAALDALQKEEP